MKRALELALLGSGYVSPNPMVGCVIVHNNRIIGEGWHQQYGGPHAEVNAFASVNEPGLLPESTVYVTLEPCAHFGKTPPCCDLIILKRVKRVVVACIDPFTAVSGKGLAKIKEAGIAVTLGILEKEAIHLNRRFFTAISKKRPYIILKWAQTSDGFMARANGDSKWISNPLSRTLVHQYRHEEDAILVGAGTLLADNPELTTRFYPGKDPLRVILELHGHVGDHFTVFQDGKNTLLWSASRADAKNIRHFDITEVNWLENILTSLIETNINSILIEGGAKTLALFLEKGLWDEIRCFKAPATFSSGLAAPALPGLVNVTNSSIGGDHLITGFNPLSL